MIYHFGAYTFDPDGGTLRCESELINAEPQVLRVLEYLLTHRGRVVSRDELFEQCWPESYVTDSSLTSCLNRVRRAIGQTRSGPTFIQTRHRLGYQFVGEVREEAAPLTAETSAPVSTQPPELVPERADPPILAVPTETGAPEPTSAVISPEPLALTERRYLSVLSCTLCDAEVLAEQLDPEDYYDLMQHIVSSCEAIVSQYEGRIAQLSDAGLVAYFDRRSVITLLTGRALPCLDSDAPAPTRAHPGSAVVAVAGAGLSLTIGVCGRRCALD